MNENLKKKIEANARKGFNKYASNGGRLSYK